MKKTKGAVTDYRDILIRSSLVAILIASVSLLLRTNIFPPGNQTYFCPALFLHAIVAPGNCLYWCVECSFTYKGVAVPANPSILVFILVFLYLINRASRFVHRSKWIMRFSFFFFGRDVGTLRQIYILDCWIGTPATSPSFCTTLMGSVSGGAPFVFTLFALWYCLCSCTPTNSLLFSALSSFISIRENGKGK